MVLDKGPALFLCMLMSSFPITVCWNEHHFLIEWFWHPCQIIWPYAQRLMSELCILFHWSMLLFFFFFFFFLATLVACKSSPGQGSNLSHSSNSTGSLTARPLGSSYMYIFMLIPHCFDYCSLVIKFEIKKHEPKCCSF